MNNKSNKRKIREALGLPSDTFKIMGVVADDSVSENTISNAVPLKSDGFFFGASGGATSPYTEVNADHQGVIDETIGASGGATLPNTKENPKSRTAHQELPDNNK